MGNQMIGRICVHLCPSVAVSLLGGDGEARGERAGADNRLGRSRFANAETTARGALPGDEFELLGFAELAERVDGGLAVAGADDGAVAVVGAVFRGDLADRRPGGAVAAEDQVMLDGEFEAGAGELPLDGEDRGGRAAVREAVESVAQGTPA